jgi:hypothetical protein
MPKFDPERDISPEIITAVGLLTIYASQLDVGLVAVLAALTGTRIAQADAILHSTANAKARVDLVRAAATECQILDEDKRSIGKLLDRASSLSGRRNEWIHGFWHRKDGSEEDHQVTVYAPNRAVPEKIMPLNASAAKEIRRLCTEYNKLTGELVLLSLQLRPSTRT